jgi:ferredoxin, 2Fe-2S
MCKVTFLPENITIEAKKNETILDLALDNNIDLQHNCGGVCACSTCHVIIKSGGENLSKMQDNEADQLDKAEALTLNSRLGCQAKILGDIVLEIPRINETLKPLFHEGKTNKE